MAPASVPGPTGSLPDGADQAAATELTRLLKGVSVGAATTVLEVAGWTVQPHDLDDPDVTFTADYRPDRATIDHRAGVVVAILVG